MYAVGSEQPLQMQHKQSSGKVTTFWKDPFTVEAGAWPDERPSFLICLFVISDINPNDGSGQSSSEVAECVVCVESALTPAAVRVFFVVGRLLQTTLLGETRIVLLGLLQTLLGETRVVLLGMVRKIQCHVKGHDVVRHQCCGPLNMQFAMYTYCLSDGVNAWEISKRFSDFDMLDKELQNRYPKRMLKIDRYGNLQMYACMRMYKYAQANAYTCILGTRSSILTTIIS